MIIQTSVWLLSLSFELSLAGNPALKNWTIRGSEGLKPLSLLYIRHQYTVLSELDIWIEGASFTIVEIMNIESRDLTADLKREGKIVMRVKLMVIGGVHSFSCPILSEIGMWSCWFQQGCLRSWGVTSKQGTDGWVKVFEWNRLKTIQSLSSVS